MAWSSEISVVNRHSARSGKTHQVLPLRPPSSDNVASRAARLPKVTPEREIWEMPPGVTVDASGATLSLRGGQPVHYRWRQRECLTRDSTIESPSSPAAAGDWAARTPCCWHRRARRSSSTIPAAASPATAPTPGRPRRWRGKSSRPGVTPSRAPTRWRHRAGGQAIIDTALDRYGRIDILVHNAGIVRRGSLKEMTYDDFEAVARRPSARRVPRCAAGVSADVRRRVTAASC